VNFAEHNDKTINTGSVRPEANCLSRSMFLDSTNYQKRKYIIFPKFLVSKE